MKLTEEKLKQLIVEVMSEHLTKVDPPKDIPPEFLDKIHSLIDSGDPEYINQAQSFIDALGGDPNYVRNYIEYPEVGDMEKLGNEANAAHGFSKFFSSSPDIGAKAEAAAKEKALRASGGFDPPPLSPHGGPMDDRTKDFFDTMHSTYSDRYLKNAARGKFSRISKRPLVDPKDFLE